MRSVMPLSSKAPRAPKGARRKLGHFCRAARKWAICSDMKVSLASGGASRSIWRCPNEKNGEFKGIYHAKRPKQKGAWKYLLALLTVRRSQSHSQTFISEQIVQIEVKESMLSLASCMGPPRGRRIDRRSPRHDIGRWP